VEASYTFYARKFISEDLCESIKVSVFGRTLKEAKQKAKACLNDSEYKFVLVEVEER